jgi:hypothetical protein
MSNITTESIEISNIKLNLNGIVVDLNVEEARKLWSRLDELFGPKPATWVYPWFQRDVHGTPYTGPLWVNPPQFGDFPYQVTCNAYSGNSLELR